MRIGCVVMAAGAGRRFGENKLLAPLQGVPLYRRALTAVPPQVFDRVVVVTGCGEIARAAEDCGFSVIRNDAPELGISRTVRLGLQAMEDLDGVLFMTADQPFLTAATVKRLTEVFAASPDRIVAAAADGQRGNPCLFPAELFPALLALEGDTGGARVIRANPHRVTLAEVPSRELLDTDTRQMLEALEETERRNV